MRKVPLLAGLPPADLARLAQKVETRRLAAGELLFEEGQPGDRAYLIQSGQVEIFRQHNGRAVLLAVRHPGEVIGELSLLEATPRTTTARARQASVLLVIHQGLLDELLEARPETARAMLHAYATRLRATERLLNQSEKLAQLGVLSAGLAHELNNPAAAARSGGEQLRRALDDVRAAGNRLRCAVLSPGQAQTLARMEEQAIGQPGTGVTAGWNALERSDRQADLESWLAVHAVPEAWKISTALVELAYDPLGLDHLAAVFPPELLSVALAWQGALYTAYALVYEIETGAGRMMEIVQAMRTYVYLDQAPVLEVDVHEGLENTLVLLRSKLRERIQVHRYYDPHLPHIQAYGSELNQVWTNLLDNAADAIQGPGNITLRTRREGEGVLIELEDDGPGIPRQALARIFEPFFTTKLPGQGAGLGLSIAYNIVAKHSGEIQVTSRPGCTVFRVYLPLDFETAAPGPARGWKPDDARLRSILETAHTIAVVGAGSRPEEEAYRVPAYLHAQGYHLLPVRPGPDTLLGQPAYPGLESLPEAPDIVLLFLPAGEPFRAIEAAILAGARTVWIQAGAIDPPAANLARQAGLQVVMEADICSEYRRLVGRPLRASP
ncbi:MAG: cyclic nucleotide-binding domain-containing protein [Chloroflexi bacterium]|nr:cyclic nucleotide-binding domain-containing protein [Chloroflexota bacterium]